MPHAESLFFTVLSGKSATSPCGCYWSPEGVSAQSARFVYFSHFFSSHVDKGGGRLLKSQPCDGDYLTTPYFISSLLTASFALHGGNTNADGEDSAEELLPLAEAHWPLPVRLADGPFGGYYSGLCPSIPGVIVVQNSLRSSRLERVLNSLGLGRHAKRQRDAGVLKRRVLSLEPLELRTLLSVFTWTGGGGDNNWTTGANWQGGSAPGNGDSLVFSGTNRLNNNNNFPGGTLFGSITFSHLLWLAAMLSASAAASPSVLT